MPTPPAMHAPLAHAAHPSHAAHPAVTADPAGRAPSARRMRTRERLLDAALDLFAENGVEATSIEAVCERAGFTRGAFYSNFADKAELIDALADREQDAAVAQLRAVIDSSPWECSEPQADDLAMIGEVATTLLDALALDRRWGIINGELRVMALRDPHLGRAHQVREDLLLGAVAEEILRLLDSLGREVAIPARTFVRLLWAGFQVDIENVERSGPGGPTATELASAWMPVIVGRLTQPRA